MLQLQISLVHSSDTRLIHDRACSGTVQLEHSVFQRDLFHRQGHGPSCTYSEAITQVERIWAARPSVARMRSLSAATILPSLADARPPSLCCARASIWGRGSAVLMECPSELDVAAFELLGRGAASDGSSVDMLCVDDCEERRLVRVDRIGEGGSFRLRGNCLVTTFLFDDIWVEGVLQLRCL
jgi:hypothetical protein